MSTATRDSAKNGSVNWLWTQMPSRRSQAAPRKAQPPAHLVIQRVHLLARTDDRRAIVQTLLHLLQPFQMGQEHRHPREQVLAQRAKAGMLKMMVVGRHRLEYGPRLLDQHPQHARHRAALLIQHVPEIEPRQIGPQAFAAIASQMEPGRVLRADFLAHPRLALRHDVAGRRRRVDGVQVVDQRQQRFQQRFRRLRRSQVHLRRRQHVGDIAGQHVARRIAARPRFNFIDRPNVARRLGAGQTRALRSCCHVDLPGAGGRVAPSFPCCLPTVREPLKEFQ